MTMTLNIAHKSGDHYQAKISVEGRPDVVLTPGENADVSIHSGMSVAITEEPYAKSAPADTNIGETVEDNTAKRELGTDVAEDESKAAE